MSYSAPESPLRFFPPSRNLILNENTVLTPSSEIATLPFTNLLDTERSAVSSFDDVADENLVIDLGSAHSVNTAILINTNLTALADVDIQGHTANLWTSPDVDHQMTYNSRLMILSFTPATKRYWRFRFQDPTNTASGIQVGKIFLGTYSAPSRNFKYGIRKTLIDLTEKSRVQGGQKYSNLKPLIYRIACDFRHESADVAILKAVFEEVGIGQPLYIAFDYDNAPNDETYYGEMESLIETSKIVKGIYDVAGFVFEENA